MSPMYLCILKEFIYLFIYLFIYYLFILFIAFMFQ